MSKWNEFKARNGLDCHIGDELQSLFIHPSWFHHPEADLPPGLLVYFTFTLTFKITFDSQTAKSQHKNKLHVSRRGRTTGQLIYSFKTGAKKRSVQDLDFQSFSGKLECL